MSKLYQLNRMRGAPAAGSIFTLIGGAAKFVGKLLSGKTAQAAVTTAKQIVKNPIVQGGAAVTAMSLAQQALAGGGGGATGSWRRRRKGISGAELRGFHKVARLLHKEGMVVKHARGRK